MSAFPRFARSWPHRDGAGVSRSSSTWPRTRSDINCLTIGMSSSRNPRHGGRLSASAGIAVIMTIARAGRAALPDLRRVTLTISSSAWRTADGVIHKRRLPRATASRWKCSARRQRACRALTPSPRVGYCRVFRVAGPLSLANGSATRPAKKSNSSNRMRCGTRRGARQRSSRRPRKQRSSALAQRVPPPR